MLTYFLSSMFISDLSLSERFLQTFSVIYLQGGLFLSEAQHESPLTIKIYRRFSFILLVENKPTDREEAILSVNEEISLVNTKSALVFHSCLSAESGFLNSR